jgi:hypothetical protein
MNTPSAKMEFDVVSVRRPAQAGEARCKQATIALDTDLAGNPLAFNPAELLHDNVRKFGTVFNTVAPGTALSGVLRRKGDAR